MGFALSPFWLTHLGFDAAICATALFFSWKLFRLAHARGERRTPVLAAAVVAGGACGLLPWIALGGLDGTIWGFCLAARALWTGATVAAPIAAAAAAVRSRGLPWLLPAAMLLAMKWWGEIGDPRNLEVQRVTIPVEGLRSRVRVAHFSDLQTDGIRPMELRARAEANAFEADFVVFTGDIMNHPSLAASTNEYLSGFEARRAKLFVGGDVDGGLDRAAFSAATGFKVLDGRSESYAVDRTRVAFLGFGLNDYRLGRSFAESLIRRSASSDVRIALSHRPDAAFSLEGLPVAILFTGHTHGGQIVVPGFGPPVTLTRVSREVAAGGILVPLKGE